MTIITITAMAVIGIAVALLWGAKKFFLEHTTFSDGIISSIILAATLGLIGCAIGIFIHPSYWGAYLGLFAGSMLGAIAGVAYWNYGRFDVEKGWRVLFDWNGKRQPGKEADEGRRHALPYFIGHTAYNMLVQVVEQTVSVEVDNNTQVGIPFVVGFERIPGKLYEHSQVPSFAAMLAAELAGGAQAFANSKQTLDRLTDKGAPEELRRFIAQVLSAKASGNNCRAVYTGDGDDRTVVVEPGDACPEWGVRFTSITVKDFDLPKNITDAGSEVTEAELREKAADVHRRSMMKTIDDLDGSSPELLAAAHAVNMPDRPNPFVVHVIPGLREGFGALSQGISVLGNQKSAPLRKPRGKAPIQKQSN